MTWIYHKQNLGKLPKRSTQNRNLSLKLVRQFEFQIQHQEKIKTLR